MHIYVNNENVNSKTTYCTIDVEPMWLLSPSESSRLPLLKHLHENIREKDFV